MLPKSSVMLASTLFSPAINAAGAFRHSPGVDPLVIRAAFASMRDTDQFAGLVQAHGLAPTQALRLADPRFAQRVDGDAANLALNAAARDGVPLALVGGGAGAGNDALHCLSLIAFFCLESPCANKTPIRSKPWSSRPLPPPARRC